MNCSSSFDYAIFGYIFFLRFSSSISIAVPFHICAQKYVSVYIYKH